MEAAVPGDGELATVEAVALCGGSCGPVWWRLWPCVVEAVTSTPCRQGDGPAAAFARERGDAGTPSRLRLSGHVRWLSPTPQGLGPCSPYVQ